MNITTDQSIRSVLAAFSVVMATGCGDRQASSGHPASTQNAPAREGFSLKELEAKVGMAFPPNAVMVNAVYGPERATSMELYACGVFSPTPFTMPVMSAPGVKGYLKLPLENSVKYVQGMVPGRQISHALSSFSSNWNTNGYDLRGTVIRTTQGEYLAIELFRKK